jgi:hypothetical protein
MANKTIAIKVDLQGTTAQKKKLVELEKELQELTSARKDLNKQVGKSKKLTNEQAKERAALNLKLKQTRTELLKTRQDALGLDGFTTKLGKSFSKLGTAISGAFVGLFALQKVFELATSAADLVQELDKLTVDIQRLGNESEDTSRKVSSSILAISSTFEASTKDILTAANAVSSQFGISIEDAIEKIKLGFASGSNASGEFLEILKEYPALLKETGLTADESFALINQQVTQGVFSDKGVDAIKEAGLRLRELTPATKEALDGIGLSSEEIQKALSSGSKSIFDVIQDVSTELGKLPPQSSAVGTAIADIFGGPGEDAGLNFLTTLSDIDLSFDNVISDIDEYGQSQLDLVNAQEGFNSLINEFFGESSVGFNQIKAIAIELFTTQLRNLFNIVTNIRDSFVDLFNSSEAFRQVIFGLKSVFSALFDAVSIPLNVLVSTIQTVVESFSFLIDGEFKKAGDAFINGFKRTGSIVVDETKNIVNTFVKNSDEASKAIIKIQTDEEKAIIESKKRQAIQNQQLAQQRALDAAKEASVIKKAADKAKKDKEKADKVAKRDAERKAKIEANEKEKALSNEQRFLAKIDDLRIKSNLAAINDEKKLQLEKLRLKKDALKQEAQDSILSKENLNTALAEIDRSFDLQESAIKASFEQNKNQIKKEQIVESALFAVETSKSLINSIANLEVAAEKRKFERGIINEEEFALAKYNIEKKAFNAQKKADIASTIINGAVAASKAFAQGGILGFATSALVAIQTAAQVAAISKQTFPASFADGGYTGDGFGSPDSSGFKQAGVVHEGEYVVPKNVLESQKGSSLVGALEAMRTNRPQPFSNFGFANGGFASAGNIDIGNLRSEISQAVADSVGAIQVVNNATDTISQAARVTNIQSEATFG